jgi:hypothetical protein
MYAINPADGSKIVVVLKKFPFFNCGRIIYYFTNKNIRLNKTYAIYLKDQLVFHDCSCKKIENLHVLREGYMIT